MNGENAPRLFSVWLSRRAVYRGHSAMYDLGWEQNSLVGTLSASVQWLFRPCIFIPVGELVNRFLYRKHFLDDSAGAPVIDVSGV